MTRHILQQDNKPHGMDIDIHTQKSEREKAIMFCGWHFQVWLNWTFSSRAIILAFKIWASSTRQMTAGVRHPRWVLHPHHRHTGRKEGWQAGTHWQTDRQTGRHGQTNGIWPPPPPPPPPRPPTAMLPPTPWTWNNRNLTQAAKQAYRQTNRQTVTKGQITFSPPPEWNFRGPNSGDSTRVSKDRFSLDSV